MGLQRHAHYCEEVLVDLEGQQARLLCRIRSPGAWTATRLVFAFRAQVPWYREAQVLADLEGQQAAAPGQENPFWGVGGLFGKARPAAAQLAAAAAQFGTVKN